MVEDRLTITLMEVILEVTMVEDTLILILMEVIDLETPLVKLQFGVITANIRVILERTVLSFMTILLTLRTREKEGHKMLRLTM